MSLRRWAAKADDNAQEIMLALRQVGCSVQRLSEPGVPDLLVARNGRLWLMEVKKPKGKLTPIQKEWHANWQAPVYVVHSVDEALHAVIGQGQCPLCP